MSSPPSVSWHLTSQRVDTRPPPNVWFSNIGVKEQQVYQRLGAWLYGALAS